MIYLAAATSTTTTLYRGRRSRGKALHTPREVDVRQLWDRPDVGVMLTPTTGPRLQLVERAACFGVDTGNFTKPVDPEAYLAFLATLLPYRARCLFATAPDVVQDWPATWALSEAMLPRIRALGLPAALVAQDGLTLDVVPWDSFDVLFVGGSTNWKLSEATYALVREATARGKRTHMGRVNSWQRLRAAALSGYDSADGTCLTRNPPQYVQEIASWMDRLRHPRLDLFALEPSA